MNKKKKALFVGIAVAALSAATFFGACEGTSNAMIFTDVNKSTSGTKHITFYGYKNKTEELLPIESSLHNFMSEHTDINITYEGVANTNDVNVFERYENLFNLRYKSGNLDDVFMIKQTELKQLSKAGDLADLRDAINLDAFNSLVRSQIVNSDGSVYIVPMALTSYALYVNYDLLKGQKVPENLSEFTQVCNSYVQEYAAAGKDLAPIICNNNRSLIALAQAYGMYDLYQLDSGDVDALIAGYNRDPEELCTKYLNKGIKFVYDALNNGWINGAHTKATAQTRTEANGDLAQFMKGEQPFMVTGSWATSRITNTEEGKKMNYGIYALPVLENGSALIFDIDICTAVNKHSKNLSEAKSFISYLTKPESVWDYCNLNNSYSPLKNETREPDHKTLAPIIPYYKNGKSVLGTDFRFTGFDLSEHLKSVLSGLRDGKLTYEQACEQLLQELRAKTSEVAK